MEGLAALVAVLGVLVGVLSLVRLILTIRRRPFTTWATDATVEVRASAAHRTADQLLDGLRDRLGPPGRQPGLE